MTYRTSHFRALTLTFLAVTLLMGGGCSNTMDPSNRALIGGLVGAGVGAGVGSGSGTGAAAGAGIGAAAGLLTGLLWE